MKTTNSKEAKAWYAACKEALDTTGNFEFLEGFITADQERIFWDDVEKNGRAAAEEHRIIRNNRPMY